MKLTFFLVLKLVPLTTRFIPINRPDHCSLFAKQKEVQFKQLDYSGLMSKAHHIKRESNLLLRFKNIVKDMWFAVIGWGKAPPPIS